MQADKAEDDAAALDAQARAWLRRLRSGAATERDAREFKAWCARSPAHRRTLARAEQAWRAIGQAQACYEEMFPERRGQAAALLRRQAPVESRRRFLRGAAVAGAAAALAAVTLRPPLHLWPSLQDMAADHRTATGEQARLALAGNLELLLNTQTSIDIARGAGPAGGDRILLIDGEVALRRQPGAGQVEIVAGGGRIVPGDGAVEVRRAGTRYCVTCTAGEARLAHASGTMALRQRERVWYDRQGVGPAGAVDLEVASAWQHGQLLFRAVPLREAVDEINRYRRGRVMVSNQELASRRLSGQFRIADLDEAIRHIQQIYHAQVTRLPGGFVILG
ncbi:hypothetical protein BKK79_29215 [Cupriavidus sp. USMAA2-4]|uniref:FecR family protein n=1 Tax=Cupriavidus sp. USMAA2-4 TaxID=876364 RepID=UPI0008A6FC3A|nr:DUF4880 domain-containing protein [Cupriavidus sp. USMAA2-4]AOY95777.1 hypothetical protein BKK79_29215 [Cupriavidus sp. USMAA2-4]